jgi:hypothetical protein
VRTTVWPKRARESFGVGSAIEIVVHPNDLSTVAPGTSAAGIAADAMGKSMPPMSMPIG